MSKIQAMLRRIVEPMGKLHNGSMREKCSRIITARELMGCEVKERATAGMESKINEIYASPMSNARLTVCPLRVLDARPEDPAWRGRVYDNAACLGVGNLQITVNSGGSRRDKLTGHRFDQSQLYIVKVPLHSLFQACHVGRTCEMNDRRL